MLEHRTGNRIGTPDSRKVRDRGINRKGRTMKLSKKAIEHAECEWIDVDLAELKEFVKDSLERPGEAAFWDEDLYVTHTLAFHTPDWDLTDDYIIEQANYRAALEILEPLGAEAATVGHWTYSRFECIKVPMLTKKGKITAAAVALWELVRRIEDYPVLDEELWSELEWEVNERAMTDALEWEERQRDIEISDDEKAKISELYWERWNGYHEAGYVDDDEFQPIVDAVLAGEYQLHQEITLY